MKQLTWPNRLLFVLLVLAVIMLTGMSLWPTLSNGFVDWDDHVYLLNNPDIRISEISWSSISKVIWSPYGQKNFLAWPVTLTFALEHYFFGLNPFIYHTTNLVLHLLNCVLVFYFIWLLSKNRLAAFITSLLFGIHPAHVESVAWVCERKDVLYTLFYMASLICYLHFKRSSLRRFYIISLLLFFVSIQAKPMAVMLPVILILIEIFDNRPINKKTFLILLPYLAVCLLVSVNVLWAQYFGFIKQPETRLTFSPHINYLFYASFIPLYHLWQLFFPIKLSCVYPTPVAPEALPTNYLLAPILLIALIVAALYMKKYSKSIPFGVFFYLVSILPALEIFPVNSSIIYDHYTYVPSVGLFFLIGLALHRLLSWTNNDRKFFRIIICAGISLGALTLCVMTWNQSKVWNNPLSLWSNVARHFPRYSFPLNNLGSYYFDGKDFKKSRAYFQKAVRVNPRDPIAHNNLTASEFEIAKQRFTKRGSLSPKIFYDPHSGHLLSDKQIKGIKRVLDEAIAGYTKAILIDPHYATAYLNRGRIYLFKMQITKALENFDEAIALNPRYGNAWLNRGKCYLLRDQAEEAVSALDTAIKIDPSDLEAYALRAQCFDKQNQFQKALIDYNVILSKNPQHIDARIARGSCYIKKGEIGLAFIDLNKAIQMAPHNADAYYWRAVGFGSINNLLEARADCKKALALDPVHPQAIKLVQSLDQLIRKQKDA